MIQREPSPNQLKNINIKVKTLTSELYEFCVPRDTKVSQMKRQIQQVIRIPVHRQRLLFKGKLLQDSQPLHSYKIEEGHVIQVVANTQQASQRSQSTHHNPSQNIRIEQFRRRNDFYQRHRYLQRRMNGFRINQPESMEVLQQNKYTIDQLIEAMEPVGEEPISQPFSFKNRIYQVGAWIDVRDAMGQWYEGQVIGCHERYVLIHYNGWSDRWNEWIQVSSPRILPFRSHTVQSTHSLYMSPFPLNAPALTKSNNPNFQKTLPDFLQCLQKTLGKINNLVRQTQNQEREFDDANTYRQEVDSKRKQSNMVVFDNRSGKLQSDYIIDIQNHRQEQQPPQLQTQEQETPTKQMHHNVSLNDNISNKCDDNVSNKCDNDDMSNKSYKSKRSEGLVDTSSMKSLKIEDKPCIFFDLEAKSVRSMKSQIQKTAQQNYLNRRGVQQNILEQEDSQVQQQDSCYRLDKRVSKNKHIKESRMRKENQKMIKASQLAPLLDRMGRLMMDLAPHVALSGNTDQIANQQNLSMLTNQGSLQSRIVNYLRGQTPQQQPVQAPSSPPFSSQYCDFQIPIMLTPIQIYALNEIQSQNPSLEG